MRCVTVYVIRPMHPTVLLQCKQTITINVTCIDVFFYKKNYNRHFNSRLVPLYSAVKVTRLPSTYAHDVRGSLTCAYGLRQPANSTIFAKNYVHHS